MSDENFRQIHAWLRNATDDTLSFPPSKLAENSGHITIVRSSIMSFLEEWSPKIHGRVLDVGVGTWTFCRDLISDHCEYISTDVYKNTNIDIVSDIHNLQSTFDENRFDFVICTDVLEHLTKPWVAVNQLYYVLKKGGTLLLTTPFNYPLHEYKGSNIDVKDYWRITESGLRLLLANFQEINIKTQGLKQFPDNYLVAAKK